MTSLAADGDFAFATPSALVGADQNTASAGQNPEAGNDVYEWRDGRALLVSDGLTDWPTRGAPQVASISPSGRDLFFMEAAQLTPDALDGYQRLYDARIGGGIEFTATPGPCPLEVCQGTPKGTPEESAPGTAPSPAPATNRPSSTSTRRSTSTRPNTTNGGPDDETATLCPLDLPGLCALGALGAAPALAATVWNLEMHHHETNFTSTAPGSVNVTTPIQGSATTNEAQEIIVKAEAGKFTLSFEGDTTPELPFNAEKVSVETALRNLPSIGSPNVAVKRAASGDTVTFTVTFPGALADTDVPEIVAAQGATPLTLNTRPQYWFDLNNVGSSASSGPIDLTINLPAGLTSKKVIVGDEFTSGPALTWSLPCSGESGATTVECHTTAGSIPRHTLAHLILEVNVEPSAAGEESASATLSGGGAADPVSDVEPTLISSTPAGFGIVASSFKPDFFKADGLTPEREAGGHPDLLTFPVDFNSVSAPTAKKPNLKREAESIRDLHTDQPPGFLGNPTAVGECTQAQYTVGACPLSSQVGRIDGSVYPPGAGLVWNFSTGVFNMVHPRGAVTDLGFQVAENPVHVKASLDPANHYAITTFLANINETAPPFSAKVTIWGVPADQSHDSERCPAFASTGGGVNNTNEECSTDAAKKAFLTMPSQCQADNVFRFRRYDSWQHTGLFGPEADYTMPGLMTDCDKPRFEPDVSLEPTGRQANTPTGLDVHITVPQNENPNGLATPPVKSTDDHPAPGDDRQPRLRRWPGGLLRSPDRAGNRRPGRLPRQLADRRSHALHAAAPQTDRRLDVSG